jgi:hypothetical protein
MQTEILRSLQKQMGLTYPFAELDLEVLLDAPMTILKVAVTTLDEMRRLVDGQPIAHQLHESRTRQISEKRPTGRFQSFNSIDAVTKGHIPATVSVVPQPSSKTKALGPPPYHEMKHNSNSKNLSMSNSSVILHSMYTPPALTKSNSNAPVEKKDISPTSASKYVYYLRSPKDNALIIKEIDEIITSYKGLLNPELTTLDESLDTEREISIKPPSSEPKPPHVVIPTNKDSLNSVGDDVSSINTKRSDIVHKPNPGPATHGARSLTSAAKTGRVPSSSLYNTAVTSHLGTQHPVLPRAACLDIPLKSKQNRVHRYRKRTKRRMKLDYQHTKRITSQNLFEPIITLYQSLSLGTILLHPSIRIVSSSVLEVLSMLQASPVNPDRLSRAVDKVFDSLPERWFSQPKSRSGTLTKTHAVAVVWTVCLVRYCTCMWILPHSFSFWKAS